MNISTHSTIDFKLGKKVIEDEVISVDNNGIYIKRKSRVGLASLATKTGNSSEIILPKYKKIYDFVNDRAIVLSYYSGILGKRYGLIDKEGRELIQPDCIGIIPVDNQYIANRLDYGALYDHNGNLLSKFDDKKIYPLERDYLKFKRNGWYGLINKNGEIITKSKYDSLELVKENIYLISCDYFTVKNHNYEQVNSNNNASFYGLMNNQGIEIIKPKYLYIEALCDYNYLVLTKNGKWKKVNQNDKKIVSLPKKYQYVSFKNEKVGIVRLNDKYGLIDLDGNTILEPIYSSIGEFKDGIAIITDNGKQGLINDKGKVILKPIHKEIGEFNNGLAIVKTAFEYNLITKEGNTRLSSDYQKLIYHNGVYLASNGTNGHVLDSNGEKITDDEYESLSAKKDSICFKKDGKYGLMNIKGDILIPPIYKHKMSDIEIKDNLIIVRYDKVSLFTTKSYFSLWDTNQKQYFHNIKVDNAFILNEEQVLINGYIFNLNELKQTYNVDINIEGVSVTREFDSEELRKKYITLFNKELKNKVSEIKEDYENKIEKLEEEKDNTIKKILKQ